MTIEQLRDECYCRQEDTWRKQNPGKCLSRQIAQSNNCNDTNINKGCRAGETSVNNWDEYKNQVEIHCKDCFETTPPDRPELNSNDCLNTKLYSDRHFSIYEQLRRQHNMLNKLAQMGIYNWKRENNLNETVLKDINDNLDKNINIGNINLINKQKQLYTKKRLLLYDEQNDRIYRVFILILKSILLIMSIIVIKLLSN
tara:strand:- start:143 stop:739 length:597 start_codon:yes stop_codon:yes gene_type:complete